VCIAPKDPNSRAALEALALVGQLGLVSILSFGLMFAAGWWLDQLFGTKFFIWGGVLLGIAALYFNAAKILKKFWQMDDDSDTDPLK
jgi:F0F1-type ATP synthase assembly protein I